MRRPPFEQDDVAPIGIDVEMKIGGLLGFGSASMFAKCNMNQNRVYPGDKLSAEVKIDNSLCDKDIEFYKLLLFRVVTSVNLLES